MSFLWSTLKICDNNVIEAVDNVCYFIYSTTFINTINSYYIILILHLYHCKKNNSLLNAQDEFIYFYIICKVEMK